jgi:phosphopantothenoylcysteine decarboxylase/phosphopantothenate--cysteine ligase
MELYETMIREAPEHQIVIQTAAVADYRFENKQETKVKRKGKGPLTVTLIENPDIARAVGEAKREGQILVGFAAETDHLKENAEAKLSKKNLDMIVANDVTKPGAGFNVDTNIASLITREGTEDLPLQSKRELAEEILNRIVSRL